MKKALIAMSGGVDSSVAAYLMKKAGYDCIGATMRLYTNEDAGIKSRTCCSLEDVEDARDAAYKIGIPYYVFNFTEDFRSEVIDRFVKSYLHAKTPNPCIDCNRYMKFDRLLKRAEILGCEKIVTGHYAKITEENGKFVLKKAADENKDQSYVLYNLTQEILAHTALPLGNMTKSEVRKIAEEAGFFNFNKRDSQDICFVPDGNYAKTVESFAGKMPEGDFIDINGKKLGKHRGIMHYTVGQRKGLGISASEPLYVCKILPEENTVVLGRDEDLYTREFFVSDLNWISGISPSEPFFAKAKVRYRQKESPVKVYPETENTVRAVFDEPQRAITPGQAAVFYDGDTVLGGGIIQ